MCLYCWHQVVKHVKQMKQGPPLTTPDADVGATVTCQQVSRAPV